MQLALLLSKIVIRQLRYQFKLRITTQTLKSQLQTLNSIIQTKMFNNRSSRASRTSRLTDRFSNTHLGTDALYDPLRKTLQRVSMSPLRSKSNLSPSPSAITPYAHQTYEAPEKCTIQSRVSRNMRQLSPEEADYLKRTTFIPMDKKLVPTNHLYKIAGKVFEAVSIQQKYLHPISQEQMQFARTRSPAHEETLYEFTDDYPYRNNGMEYGFQDTQNTYFESTGDYFNFSQPQLKEESIGDLYQIRFRTGTGQKQQRQQSNQNIRGNIRVQQNLREPQPFQYASQGASERNIVSGANPSMQNHSFNPNYVDYYQHYRNSHAMNIHPPILSRNPTQPTSLASNRNPFINNNENGMSRQQSQIYTHRSSSSRYDFSKNIDRSDSRSRGFWNNKDRSSSKSRSKPKSSYKYNLYSALDPVLNTGCKKGCGENEVIATKPEYNYLN